MTASRFPMRSAGERIELFLATMMRWRCSPPPWLAMMVTGDRATAMTAVVSPMVPMSALPERRASEQAGPLLKTMGLTARPSSRKKPFPTAIMLAASATRS